MERYKEVKVLLYTVHNMMCMYVRVQCQRIGEARERERCMVESAIAEAGVVHGKVGISGCVCGAGLNTSGSVALV